MPTQNHPVEPSAFRELQRRVERLEKENHRSSGRKLLTADRFTTADLSAPTEGQIAIEATNDDLKYYANSAWRTVGGADYWSGPWTQWTSMNKTITSATLGSSWRNIGLTTYSYNGDTAYFNPGYWSTSSDHTDVTGPADSWAPPGSDASSGRTGARWLFHLSASWAFQNEAYDAQLRISLGGDPDPYFMNAVYFDPTQYNIATKPAPDAHSIQLWASLSSNQLLSPQMWHNCSSNLSVDFTAEAWFMGFLDHDSNLST